MHILFILADEVATPGFHPAVFLIPGLVLLVVLALVVAIRVAASRYVKVAPDEIAVFSGRRYTYKDEQGKTQTRGFYILQGGGKILLPIVEKVEVIKIGAFQVEVEEENVPNKDNVGVNIKGVATCRLSIAESDMGNMITNFLNKTPQDRVEFIQNILKGHVRSIVGNLTIDQLLRNRQGMNELVVSESTPELKRLGIDVINLVIQDVRDNLGYIESLGKQKVAEALRDSKIATANAEKETAITVSTAQREAAEVSAQNETKVAEAQKLRDVQIATFKQETETKRAVAETAFAIAKTAQEQTLRVQEAKRDKAAAEAGAEVQQAEAARRTMELRATTITTAEANAKALIKECHYPKSSG
jgi:flotillin